MNRTSSLIAALGLLAVATSPVLAADQSGHPMPSPSASPAQTMQQGQGMEAGDHQMQNMMHGDQPGMQGMQGKSGYSGMAKHKAAKGCCKKMAPKKKAAHPQGSMDHM